MTLLFHQIEKLRRKPEHVRRWVAFSVTLLLFIIIVSVWLSTINISIFGKTEDGDIPKPDVLSPFTVVKDSLDGFGNSISEAGRKIGEIKKQFGDGN